MKTLALFAAVVALAACGAAGSGGPGKSFDGSGGGGGGSQQNTGGQGTDGGTDAGVDAGSVTYSLDCNGTAFNGAQGTYEVTLAYHYETRDTGHVLTNCSGSDSATGDSESQSNDYPPDGGTDSEIARRTNGGCGFPLSVQGGAADAGFAGFSCEKYYQGNQSDCVYYDGPGGPLNGTSAIMSCQVTTP